MPQKKKIPAIQILEGNPSKRLLNAAGVEGLGEPITPEHLLPDARACVEVIRESMPPRIYSRLDSFALAAFGMAWAVHKKAAETIAHPDFEWMVTNDNGNPVPNPWLKILNAQVPIMIALGSRLGLDPHARAALSAPSVRDPESKFAGLIGLQRSSSSLNA